jgi:hypothetical protein
MKKGTCIKLALLFFVASLLLPQGGWQLGADLCVVLILASRDWRALVPAGGWRFWAFPLAFVALMPCFNPAGVGLAHYDIGELRGGLFILGHAYVFASLAAFGTRSFSIREIAAASPAVGLRVALALCAARLLRRMIDDTWLHYRLTRPGFFAAAREMDIFIGAAIRNAAATAENMAALLHLRSVEI